LNVAVPSGMWLKIDKMIEAVTRTEYLLFPNKMDSFNSYPPQVTGRLFFFQEFIQNLEKVNLPQLFDITLGQASQMGKH